MSGLPYLDRDHLMYAVAKPFLVALCLSLALVPLCRLLALRMGRVAHPREDRWHRRPVALLGGVGIGLSLFTGAAAFGLGSQVPVLLTCALLMFLMGLIDDLVTAGGTYSRLYDAWMQATATGGLPA